MLFCCSSDERRRGVTNLNNENGWKALLVWSAANSSVSSLGVRQMSRANCFIQYTARAVFVSRGRVAYKYEPSVVSAGMWALLCHGQRKDSQINQMEKIYNTCMIPGYSS